MMTAHKRASGDATNPATLCFPEHFLGVFARQSQRFTPLLAEARKVLECHPVPEVVRSHYEYVVLDNPQPSFMLFPLMYLELASSAGGIGERHRLYLPWMMLAMELVAVLDDTVDETPCRSGRYTYHRRFGALSSAPFSCFLLNTLLSKTLETAPDLLPLLKNLVEVLCALQVWEARERYPALDAATCERWLLLHYDAVTPAIAYGLNSSLLLGRQPLLPLNACALFGVIMQDVDDLVNIAEHREGAGENSDFRMGIVTYPLVAALDRDPALRSLAESIWLAYRVARRADDAKRVEGRLLQGRTADVETVMLALRERGIPATLERIERNAAACVSASPVGMRGTMRDLMSTFVDRARRAAAPMVRPALQEMVT